ncbi:MAG: Thermostable beta-glucosidase B [Owenweeksia sp. TMED14]|nr:MAG: Thermostable beta-glucosidase B [Owenweeksia sp. TMED14]
MHAELDSANEIIENSLGITPSSYAYPCGHTFIGKAKETQSLVPLISSMFETGRTWLAEVPNDPVYCDMAQLTGMEMDGKSFEQIKVLIDNAKETGSWLVLAGHETDEGGSQTVLLETLEAICKYAMDPANEIWIDDVHTIAKYVREKRADLPFSAMLPYQNPALTDDQRIEDLISRMTLKEKVGQLNLIPGYSSEELGESIDERIEGSMNFAKGTQIESIGPCGGFFGLSCEIMLEGAGQQANMHNELQKVALGQTRLKIPLLVTEEGTHGVMSSGATIFPEGPALGSTWNIDLIEDVYAAAAKEARSVGIHQLFTLVIEPLRDPRLGRNQEGYSEDPFMCARYASAIVKGIQGNDVSAKDKVVAGLCHFPGQSEPVSGLERGAMDISERTLREVFLPPWEAGIKESGALGVMATYPTIDGIPAHNSKDILTGLLREELNFKGVVLSEGHGVNTLVYTGMAETIKEAAAMTANAGVDLSIFFNQGYFNEMIENVNEGKVAMETIDRSVRRILKLKFELGLFDNTIVDVDKAVEISHSEEHQSLALKAAHEGIVLLKNEDNLLPLSKNINSIAVIGPNADHEKNQLGDYTSYTVLQPITTVLDGIKNKVGDNTKVNYVQGCNVIGNELDEIDKAVKAAEESDVAVIVLGENDWQTEDKKGTSGEAYDVATLELTGLQKELVQKVHATGTPTVVILINGRALAINWVDENVPAIVEAWNPGEKGGEAVANILFGDVNPSGKLPVTFPRHAGQLPVYYNYKPSKSYWLNEGWGNSYADLKESTPLYEFGYGLSFTTFDYGNLTFSTNAIEKYGKMRVTCEVKNTGDMAGSEVVQLYIRDKLSSVVRPVKELKGFKKIRLNPGESKQLTFELGFKELKMLDKNLDWIVEPGEFEVMIGSSSEDIRLNGSFNVIE